MFDPLHTSTQRYDPQTSIETNIIPFKTYNRSALHSFETMMQNTGHLLGISTGYSDLDCYTLGMQEGQLIVITSGPSVGKTSLALNLLNHTAVDLREPCAAFFMGLTGEMLAKRLWAVRSRLAHQKLLRGHLSGENRERLARASREMDGAQIFTIRQTALGVTELRNSARYLHEKHGIRMIAIDCLQQLAFRSGHLVRENSRMKMEIVSSELKALALELNIPILLTTQLPSDLKQEPLLSFQDYGTDIPGTQFADVVGLLTRSGKCASLNLIKNCNGPLIDIGLNFVEDTLSFVDPLEDYR